MAFLAGAPGAGTLWGAVADATQPTVGNHENLNKVAYMDYWHGRPLFTTFGFGGVLFLSLVFAQSRTGQLSMRRHEPVEAGAIYWHFVDVVWIGLFTLFYILVR